MSDPPIRDQPVVVVAHERKDQAELGARDHLLSGGIQSSSDP